jgi:hypothetical protein
MAGQRKKSKKRSAASSKQPELVLFLDRNLGRSVVAERLRREGVRVEVHDDHFPDQRTSDEEWLRFAGERGWVVLTPDAKIRYRVNERTAVQSARVRQFVLTARTLTGSEIGEVLVKALPRIRRLATSVTDRPRISIGTSKSPRKASRAWGDLRNFARSK